MRKVSKKLRKSEHIFHVKESMESKFLITFLLASKIHPMIYTNSDLF